MGVSDILKKIGAPAAVVGAGVVNIATSGAAAPLTSSILKIIGDRLPDPAQKAALEQAQLEAQADLAKAELEHAEKIAALAEQDVASARARQQGLKDSVPGILGLGVTAGFFLLLAVMVFKPVPVANQQLLDVMLGALGTAEAGIITYYFGSSAGSARKTELLAGQIKGIESSE